MMPTLVASIFWSSVLLSIAVSECNGSPNNIMCQNFAQKEIQDKVINLEESKSRNATVKVFPGLRTKTIEECKSACCGQSLSECNIITYIKEDVRSNCHLFSCHPSSMCAFMKSPNTDSWLFSSLESEKDPRGQAELNHTHAVHHVENSTLSLDLVLQKILEDQKPSKKATSVVPRKGVSFPALDGINVSEVKSPIKSSVKPRKGVGLPSNVSEINQQKSEETTIAPSSSTSDSISDDKRIESSDLISNVTTKFDKTDEIKLTTTELPKKLQGMTGNASVMTTTDNILHANKDGSSSTENEALSNSTQSALEHSEEFKKPMQDHGSTISISNTMKTLTPEEPPVTNISNNVEGTSSTPSDGKVTQVAKTSISPPSVHTTLNTTEVLSTIESKRIDNTSSNSEVKPITATVNSLEAAEEDEEALKARSYAQLHVVVALILGLILLIAVLLVTARKMIDRWQRRHYRQMDYLIDGMYHN